MALLDRFWHLDVANVAEIPALLEQTRKLITVGYPSSPYVGFFSQTPSLPFDYFSVPLPVAPDGTRTTVGTTPGKPAAADSCDLTSSWWPGLATGVSVLGASGSDDAEENSEGTVEAEANEERRKLELVQTWRDCCSDAMQRTGEA